RRRQEAYREMVQAFCLEAQTGSAAADDNVESAAVIGAAGPSGAHERIECVSPPSLSPGSAESQRLRNAIVELIEDASHIQGFGAGDLSSIIEIPRPGSRMARALRARERERGVASDGVSEAPGVRPRAREDDREVVGVVPPVRCEFCGRGFQTKRGLGVHVTRGHPEAANAVIEVERDKARWSVEEVRLVARAEARASLAGVRFMNQHLLNLFPHRTLEAIKGRRRQEAYREMVQAFCLEAQTGSAAADDSVESAAMIGAAGPSGAHERIECVSPTSLSPGSAESQRLRDAIVELIEDASHIQGFGAGDLSSIARSALEGEDVMDAISGWLHATFPTSASAKPPHRATRNSRNPRSKRRENREYKRRREYAIVQTLFKKNLRSCLNRILDGDSEREKPSDVDFADYWRPLMEASSAADGDMSALRSAYREARQEGTNTSFARGIHLAGVDGASPEIAPVLDKSVLWHPITAAEVARIVVRVGSAPGCDGITPRKWNVVPKCLRALLYNILLLARDVPESMTRTRTVFLEKGGMPVRPRPADYRPLSVGTVVLRQFHKILGSRLVALKLGDTRQRGFKPVDGVCENVTVLSAVLDEARRKCRTLHLACIDLSKAFDTVGHKAIAKALEEADLPPSFQSYIRATYARAKTTLSLSGSAGEPICLGRGVRQGDPLSPLLFNLVVDRALGILSEDVGFRMGGYLVNALAYADDIVLLSSTTMGLQENLERLSSAFQVHGLEINAKKSGVLSLVASGRDKKVKVVTQPSFTLGGSLLPQRSPVEVWSYLGALYEGARESATHVTLGHAIDKIRRAPLKPQQRLRLLRDCLLPRYYHRWILGSVNIRSLKAIDVQVRTAVRSWLRLPHDVPVGYFHAPILEGGIGMPQVKTLIPLLKFGRLQRLCRSDLPAARAAAESRYVARQLVWCENHMKVRGCRVNTTVELRRELASLLHESCDGRGLREAGNSKLSSWWVSGGDSAIPGADYVHYHHVRANSIPSRARVSRGRPGHDVRCRAGCPESETPAHCVQRCFRSHGGRILRHNDLCRQVAGFLKQKGWHVEQELAFSTSAGRRRPDLTISRGGKAVVVDAQVVSSEEALRSSHRRKVDKYRLNEDLADRVAENTGVPRNDVSFTALTISWRGVWSADSEAEMRGLGLTTGQLRLLTTRVLWGSWLNWRRFNSITSRYNSGGGRRVE
ncbi:hypothetical protein KM043_018805, partial [Ampulex compressa]